MREFTIQSDLAIEPDAFWTATSMDSVNWELGPIVKMTAPNPWKHSPMSQWEVDRDLFASWILLFGCIPIDRHAFRLRENGKSLGFCESSSSWINRQWQHDRSIVACAAGCTVSDRVTVEGRIPILSPLLMPVYKFIFRRRHRRLRKKYGHPSG